MEKSWCVKVKSGEAAVCTRTAQGLTAIAQFSLVHPPTAAGARVRVWVKSDGDAYALGDLTAEQPTVVLPVAVLLAGEFTLYHDSADAGASVRFDGYSKLDQPAEAAAAPPGSEEEEEEKVAVDDCNNDGNDDDDVSVADDGEVDVEETDTESEDVSDDEELYGSDYYDDERSERESHPFEVEGQFLGPAQFASTDNTVAFMQVAAVEPADLAPGRQEEHKEEITVLYGHTRFTPSCTPRGVRKYRTTKARRLRFFVPHAGDLASSLPLVGSSLASLIYPRRYRKQLKELWSRLMAGINIPPQATRVQVLFDAGVLLSWTRRPLKQDRTEHMRHELEAKLEEAWSRYHTDEELCLPEPVPEPAQFASAGNTGGFMSVVTDATPRSEGGKEILVFYRYSHFHGTRGGEQRQGGAEGRYKVNRHRLRFIVPHAGDPASSLPWVGSSLAPLIYPDEDSRHLQELWSKLVAPVSIPPRATRVQVMVDVGILSSTDCTPECIKHMRRKLESKREKAMLAYRVHTELHLPEPMLCKEEDEADEGSKRPAKRRKVAGEDCPICFEELGSGLVKWPGCSLPHVFHGKCLERSLKESVACPLCRHGLYRS